MTAHRTLDPLIVRRTRHGFAVETPEFYCWDEDPEEVIETAEAVCSAAPSRGKRRISYTLDPHDRIFELGGSWSEFARDNGAPNLTPESVIGRHIWDFVVGNETRRLYEDAMHQVRHRGKQLVIPLRCDSPTHARWMRLVLTPGEHGEIFQQSILMHESYRVFAPLLDRSVPRGDLTLRICGFCNDCLFDSRWIALEDVLARLGAANDAMPRLEPSVCTPCVDRVRRETLHSASVSPRRARA